MRTDDLLETLVDLDVLAADGTGETLSVAPAFADSVQRTRAALTDHDDLRAGLAERFDDERVVDALARVGNEDLDFVAYVCALAERGEDLSRDDLVRTVAVLRQLRGTVPRTEGVPDFFLPVHGDAYAAGPDSAMRNGTTLAVSDESDPERFSVGLVGRWEREEADAFGDICAALTRHLGDVRRLGSMQATLALVADGTLDAVVAPSREAPWDTVAGVHLVRAAGGIVTDVDGDRWERDSQRLVASGDGAHDAVCEAVRAGLGH
jgi:hypothetical protein